jgi:hypothetical protein
MFDPNAHLIQLPRRVKDPVTGHFTTRQDDYLEVKWRLVWFREKYSHRSILTAAVLLDWEKGVAVYKATVGDGEGGIATGTGTEIRKSFEDFVEKSETRAVGRALAALGIGTQFVGAELSEGEHICDAPVSHLDAPDAAHETPGMSHPLPVGEEGTSGVAITPAPVTNGHRPAQEPDEGLAHPTESHLAALCNLAVTECQEPVDVYEDRIRTTMKIPKQASVAPRLLTRTMSMQAYMDVFAYYRRLEAQLAKGKEAPGGAIPTTQPAAQPASAPTEESLPVDPSPATASSSAAPDPTGAAPVDPAYHKLYQEALGWGVKASEIEYILHHHDLVKSRTLLWKARRQAPAATPMESAAD